MKNDMDAQFLCKDCARFNLCEYYDRRKEDSYICKYFHLTETYGMTVGEVLKAVLGIEDEQIVEAKYLVSIYPKGNHYDPFIAIKRDVWNAPYKKEGKNNGNK